MATTEYLPVSYLSQGGGPPPAQSKTHRQPKKKQAVNNHELATQNAHMARHMTCYILRSRQEGIRVSGLTDGYDSTNPAMNEASFVEARLIMERMCTRLLADHGDEVLEMIRGLDVSDARLYGEFHKGAIQIVKSGVNPGRIAGLFLFAGLLAVRLHQEGQQHKKVRSLVEWLTDVLNEYLTDWLQDINGWVRTWTVQPWTVTMVTEVGLAWWSGAPRKPFTDGMCISLAPVADHMYDSSHGRLKQTDKRC